MQASLIAQSTVSDKDLQKFANVFKRLRTIEKEVKPKVENVVKQSGIPPSRFQAIVLSKRDPSQKLSPPLSPDEDKKFMQAANKLKPLFAEVQTKSKKAVTDSGLTLQQFQTIGKAVKNDPKLKGKVQALLK